MEELKVLPCLRAWSPKTLIQDIHISGGSSGSGSAFPKTRYVVLDPDGKVEGYGQGEGHSREPRLLRGLSLLTEGQERHTTTSHRHH